MDVTPASEVNVQTERLAADEGFPNNPRLPLVVLRQALAGVDSAQADQVQRLFEAHGWGGTWQNGVYPYHHYHSNAHEALAICAGRARIQFGGPHGPVLAVKAGDVAILPAGTGHKRVEASADLLVVGGYPAGQLDYDLLRGEPAEQAQARQRIASVPLPQTDPVYGAGGPLLARWAAE